MNWEREFYREVVKRVRAVDIKPSRNAADAYWNAEDLMTLLRKEMFALDRGELGADIVFVHVQPIIDRLEELQRFLSDVSGPSSNA